MTGFLASCQTYDGPGQPISVSPKPVGIDGQWVDTRGINSANFSGGTFTSTSTETGQTMARGSYKYRDPQTITTLLFDYGKVIDVERKTVK